MNKLNNYANLNNQIHDIENELILDSDIILNDDEDVDYLIIDKENVTIDGNNHCIDAKGKAGIFKINADGVTLKNIVFKNAKYGAIVNEYGTLTILNCEFIDNKNNNSGGAIYNKYTLKAFNCKFIGNLSDDFGGAVFNYDSAFFKDCYFENNHAKNDGGAINNNNGLKILNSKFIENSSSKSGGAIYSEGLVDFYNCEFSENSADACGGAVKNDYFLRVWNCRFYKNNSNNHGGSIYCQNDTLSIVNGCEFKENSAEENGGATSTNGFIKFENSKFIKNISKGKGGALRVDKEGYLFIDVSNEFLENVSETGETYSFYSPKNINDKTEEFHAFHADYFCIPID